MFVVLYTARLQTIDTNFLSGIVFIQPFGVHNCEMYVLKLCKCYRLIVSVSGSGLLP